MRVPAALIQIVKDLSRLHRAGYTSAIVSGAKKLIAAVDSKASADNIKFDTRSNVEAIAQLTEQVKRLEQKVGSTAQSDRQFLNQWESDIESRQEQVADMREMVQGECVA